MYVGKTAKQFNTNTRGEHDEKTFNRAVHQSDVLAYSHET
jgi:hypothetical protein